MTEKTPEMIQMEIDYEYIDPAPVGRQCKDCKMFVVDKLNALAGKCGPYDTSATASCKDFEAKDAFFTSEQKEILKKNEIVCLSTSTKDGKPRSIFVAVNKVEDDKIIITDNEMKISLENLIDNPVVFVLAFTPDYHTCLKISGIAEYQTKGKYFDFIKSLPGNEGYAKKAAIVIKIEKIEV